MENKYDVIIIGGGPIGLACAIEANKAKLSNIVFEKGTLVNSIYNYPSNMTFFSNGERLEIGGIPFITHGNKPVRTEALEYYRKVSALWNVNISTFEKVLQIDKINGEYLVYTSKGNYITSNIIVATGFYDLPNLMNIEGENLPKVLHYYKDPYPFFGKNVVVAGAANSAIDAALECYRKGAVVTMVIRDDKISERVKYWVKPDIENRIRECAIKAYFNSSILSIHETTILINTPAGKMSIPNDYVLAMTGYLPDFSFLEKAGIAISADNDRIPDYNPATMETNCAGIYLAGVVCGGMNTHQWFIENSRIHAPMIIGDINSKLRTSIKK